jgi:hypothetical protein
MLTNNYLIYHLLSFIHCKRAYNTLLSAGARKAIDAGNSKADTKLIANTTAAEPKDQRKTLKEFFTSGLPNLKLSIYFN